MIQKFIKELNQIRIKPQGPRPFATKKSNTPNTPAPPPKKNIYIYKLATMTILKNGAIHSFL